MARPLTEQRDTAKANGASEGKTWHRAMKSAASSLGYLIPSLIALIIAGVVWQVWVRATDTKIYILPAPSDVFKELFGNLGFFASNGWTTLYEALIGFALGTGGSLLFAVVMASSRPIEKSLFPLAILVKVTPMVAVAPLFVIWFGFGSFPKILIAALLTFYPILVNAIVGFRSVNPGAIDFMKSINASPIEVFWRLRVPSSLPYLFAAIRITIPLAVIGAIVGEFFTGSEGLGAVINVAHNSLDMPRAFAAVFTLAVIGIGLTMVTSVIEKRLIFWHESNLAR